MHVVNLIQTQNHKPMKAVASLTQFSLKVGELSHLCRDHWTALAQYEVAVNRRFMMSSTVSQTGKGSI